MIGVRYKKGDVLLTQISLCVLILHPHQAQVGSSVSIKSVVVICKAVESEGLVLDGLLLMMCCCLCCVCLLLLIYYDMYFAVVRGFVMI